MRTRDNAAPALSANIERFSQFLTLVGLTALVVGGVGVANAVRAYLDGKRGVIATFKSLGASGGFVFAVYLVQIMLIAAIGHRHRPGRSARRCRSPRARCCPPHPGAGARRRLSLGAGAGRAVRHPGDARLRADSARPGARRAGDRAVPRDGLRRPRPAAPGLSSPAAGGDCRGACRRLPSGSPTTGALPRSSSARRSSPSWCCAPSRGACNGSGAQEPARPLDGAQAGDRQHPSARRAHRLGRALARPRADAAGHARADRRRPQAADLGQPCRSARRTSSSSTSSPARSTSFAALVRQRAPDGNLAKVPMLRGRIMAINGVEADKAERAARGRMGAARRPRPHLCRHRSRQRDAHPGRMVAEGLFRRAAGLVLVG